MHPLLAVVLLILVSGGTGIGIGYTTREREVRRGR